MATLESILRMFEKEKTVEIIQCLSERPRHIRELIETIGSSASTIVSRVRELEELGWLTHTKSGKFPFKGVIALTKQGANVAAILEPLRNKSGLDISRIENIQEMVDRRGKWILALLHAMGSQVRGSTRLEKLLFMLKDSVSTPRDDFYTFQWYKFGPFSADVLEDAKKLERAGLTKITEELLGPQDGLNEDYMILRTYSLTPQGEKLVETLLDKLSPHDNTALSNLKDFNDMPLSELLAYVYGNYDRSV